MEKKILIAESGTGFGGSAKYLASLLPLLDRKKFSVQIAACGSGPFIRQIEKDGWIIHHVPNWRFPWSGGEHKRLPAPLGVGVYALLAGLQLAVLIPWIAFWLRRRKIELVHLNNEILSHLPLLLASRLSGARTICHLHGWRHLTSTEKWASRYVDQFLSVTQSGADFYGWQLRGRTVLGVPNGLLSEAVAVGDSQKRRDKREELGLTEDDVLAVIVGRMIPLKGHSVFFKALAEARRKCPRLRGLVVGNDPSPNGIYGKKLREELSALSLDEFVTFLPWQDHMGPVYEAGDLVVQPSVDPESFGYVALEGMMAGKPVIASRIGGLVDVVQDGETGFLVAPGDSEELARAIERIAGNPALSAELGAKGKERATTLFTMERNAARIQEVYEGLFERQGKILVAESGSGFGGSAKYLAALVPFLQEKFSIDVVGYGKGPFIEQLRENGRDIFYRPHWRFAWGEKKFFRSIIQIIFLVPAIAFWLNRRGIRLVHMNNDTLSHFPLLLAARLSGARTICHFHGWRRLTRLEKWSAALCDEFIAVSDAGAQFLKSELGGREIISIPNGLPFPEALERLSEKRFRMRSDLGLWDRGKVIAIVGRLIPWKGQEVFLNALARVVKRYPDAIGMVVGYDPSPGQEYLKKLKDLAERLKIGTHVRFLPWQEDVWSVYAAADIVVHCSTEPEAFGLVILEAMHAGKPVIAAKAGAVPEIIEDGRSGYLVGPGKVEAFARAMDRLFADPESARRLGLEGQIRAQNYFTIATNAGKVEALYRRLLSNRTGNRSGTRRNFNLALKETLLRTGALSLIRNSRGAQVPILMYHRISADQDPFFPAISPNTFREQMRYIKQHYRVLSLDELTAYWHAGKPAPAGSLAVTFDDGYAETWSLAHPVLKELEIPVTIFPAIEPLEGKDFIWTDRVRWWIRLTSKKYCALRLNGYSGKWPLTHVAERLWAVGEILNRLKTMPDDQRKIAVEQLERELGVDPGELPIRWSLTWDQIKSIKGDGLAFGAHTLSHPILSRMTQDEARHEIFESKRKLEEMLGVSVNHFAYPNGEAGDFTKEHEAHVREAGFSSGMSTILGLNDSQANRFALKRIYAAEEPLASFAARLAGLGS